jgi:hypothetical protein
MGVVHRPRVAWLAARAFVAAADADTFFWLSELVGRYLGVMYELKLAETRLRLSEGPEAVFAEVAAWRAALEDLLDLQPALTPLLVQFITETEEQLARLEAG